MEKEVLRGEIYLVDMLTGIHSEQSGFWSFRTMWVTPKAQR